MKNSELSPLMDFFDEYREPMFLIDKEGFFRYGNRAFYHFFILEAGKVALHNKDYNRLLQSFFRRAFELKNKKNHYHFELTDSNKRFYSLKLIYGESISSFIGFCYDVTRYKKREELLGDRLKQIKKETQIKSDFLANISHEIRTPIHTIMGISELLAETSIDKEQEEYVSQIRFSADVLHSLVNNVLDFSKVEAGKISLEYLLGDLRTLLEQSLDLVALQAHEKGIEVGLFIDPKVQPYLSSICFDSLRLRQVLLNLLSNGVKFTSNGQVILSVFFQGISNKSLSLEFRIKDSGIGIPKVLQKGLFSPFVQADSSTTRRFGGTGLGLSISADLVRLMGGEISVSSDEGRGALFSFVLDFPFEKDQGEKDHFNLREKKVLIIIQNPLIRYILKVQFQLWGASVFALDKASQGIALLQGGSVFDLCLVDELLKDLDGWQFASRVKSLSLTKEPSLILCSLKGQESKEVKMRLLGWFTAYLKKPISIKSLKEACLLCLDPEKVEPSDLEEVIEEDLLFEGLVLVADDHEVNRSLLGKLLSKFGLAVQYASDGQQAIDFCINQDFDLILMDCQMPIKNGYKAAKEIREKGILTPIIAVTANHLSGEKENCLSFGMNDLLSKPYKQSDLLLLLRSYLKKGEKEESFYGKQPFNFDEALSRFLGDQDLLLSLLSPFLKKVEGELKDLEEAYGVKKFSLVNEIGHSIKGSACNLSMPFLAKAAKKIELGSPETLFQSIITLKKEYSQVKKEVLNILKDFDS